MKRQSVRFLQRRRREGALYARTSLSYGELKRIVTTATERARAKNARLRLLKERNEAYLAAHKDELDDELEYVEHEITRELT